MTIDRRRFLEIGSLGGVMAAGASHFAFADILPTTFEAASAAEDRTVRLGGDGIGLTPVQYCTLTRQLLEEKPVVPDTYSLGGVVEELEGKFAQALGKERAIFMPTGTLANHLAVRKLAAGPSRVLVQEVAHLYQDEGDCAQTLSNLTLMPLAPGKASFTADDVQYVLDETKNARVLNRVSVISIESPVRHKNGQCFDPAELKKIVAIAKRENIKLHLDGARLFLQTAYTGEDIQDYVRPFDTVYISLYKYFNAGAGAILAGPSSVIDGMYHVRRMFGGGLLNVWQFALVAMHYFEGFNARYRQAVRTSEEWIANLKRDERFTIERVPQGTNLFQLRVRGSDPAVFRNRLAQDQILLAAPHENTFTIGVNETINRTTASQLSDAFARAVVA
jgi:threonine aldolase